MADKDDQDNKQRDEEDDDRGLASASEETKERVARAGGKAYHEKRGQKGHDHKKAA